MTKAYHIVAWDTAYETAETRKIRTLTYYAKSNKLVGEGIGFTLAQPNNVALLGTWALIEALASTAPREYRGWLVRNGTPLTAERMSALTRVDAAHFDAALTHFSRPEVAWLEHSELPNPTGRPLGDSPDKRPPTGRPLGDSPDSPPPNGDSPESAGTISPRERERGRDLREREEGGAPALSPEIPSLDEVRAWAERSGVHPDYAVEKHAATTEDSGWVRNGKMIDWRSKWLRYWNNDREAWLKKSKKTPRAGDHPPGWQEGDADWWWTDPVSRLDAALSGALQGGDKKNAARLREIIKARKV